MTIYNLEPQWEKPNLLPLKEHNVILIFFNKQYIF